MRKMAKLNHNRTLERWAKVSSKLATLMFVWSILQQYAPYGLRRFIVSYAHQLFDVLSPYIHLSIDEFSDKHLTRDDTFACVHAYLGENRSKDAKRLRLWSALKREKRILSIDEFEEVCDRFNGITVWWALEKVAEATKTSPALRCYKLTFHRKHRDLVSGQYLDHVINEGKRIREKKKSRRLYLNSLNASLYHTGCGWTYVAFDHPARFDSLAMDPEKKREIVEDLLNFSRSKEFYSRIGKAWKRGYLLYGPPGTGKSTLVAAMANLLEYDVYDLDLSAVKNNTELKKLLINTSSRAIIVIEDIDCSINLTGKRGEKSKVVTTPGAKKQESSVTLSGLLNSIDGIWSSCGAERIIVFTTNHVKKLDPALIRTGRMDMHIELSYCGFEGFKVLANNYLLVEAHPKFEVIEALLEETKMTPADVAENLMPKFPTEDAERCLDNLIRALEKAKEDAAKRELIKKQKAEVLKKAEEAKKEADEEKTEEVKVKAPEEEVKEENVSQANETSTEK